MWVVTQSFRDVGYALVPVPDIQEYLRTTQVVASEDEQYNMSLQCEPRTSTS
jgi:hypothetical protein